ncbi:MAG: dihydrofolate reductase [Fibrobacterales bacterium]
MMLSTIVAVAENGAIGKDNSLIWRLSKDLKRFKEITTGHHIITGRKNYEDIGRPLPNRTTVIITRQKDYRAEGCVVVHSLDEAIQVAKDNGESEAFIIGGAQIYDMALPHCGKLYLTEVHQSFEADIFLTNLGEGWKEVYRDGPFPKSEKDECEYSFVNFERDI